LIPAHYETFTSEAATNPATLEQSITSMQTVAMKNTHHAEGLQYLERQLFEISRTVS
jgi:hypothetical protein